MSSLYHHAIPNTLVQKAEYVQERLRNRCSVEKVIETDDISLIAGADAAYSGDTVIAAVVVMTYPNLVKVCDSVARIKTCFPYIPGLFVFREGPGLLKAFHTLDCKPDLMILNGHGYAHPRRFGMACHIGLILRVPSIGVANHPLIGTADEPAQERGSLSPLQYEDECIGMAVRTVDLKRPVYVSAGNMTDLEQAVELVLKTSQTHRFPEPLHLADLLSKKMRNKIGL